MPLLVGMLLLALPAGVGAVTGGPGDGTLVVENAEGNITLAVRGGVIGRFDQGSIEVYDPVLGDGNGPVVRGYQKVRELGPRRAQYSGEGDVRFRLIGGYYRVKISAIGIDVSVVGRGTVVLDSSDFPDQPGRFSINGAASQSMPSEPTRFTLGQPLPANLGNK
jgi:hypothetical protein